MLVVPFQPDHAMRLVLQPMQAEEKPFLSLANAQALAAAGPCYSALDEDGTVLATAGVIPQWPGRVIAWALIAHNAGPHFVRITREVKRFLATCNARRIEVAVDAAFPAAIRWAEMLGFVRETPQPMRAYGLDGRSSYLYALVKDA